MWFGVASDNPSPYRSRLQIVFPLVFEVGKISRSTVVVDASMFEFPSSILVVGVVAGPNRWIVGPFDSCVGEDVVCTDVLAEVQMLPLVSSLSSYGSVSASALAVVEPVVMISLNPGSLLLVLELPLLLCPN